ncbi:HAD domain-containing protein [Streptomyces fructofermentans]|uniref:Secreted protein n=1 Tax=Streptomyces fructofermentans TaxID=152141 RepID=A0A918NPC7_9ACTN|nr:HAD domain-containing protein [Streptomyces fructofermentans]GGX85025.1 hypothetical protein GCM10010515_60590 [Streptomyces fructofermentans]
MTTPAGRPLLFLDVDGPLIPFGAVTRPEPYGREPSVADSGPAADGAHPLLGRIDPRHGPRLTALGCELVWATTWMADANDIVAPILGLPRLPVLAWPEQSDEEEERDVRAGLHWKTRALVGHAEGRPFVWIDDEIGGADRAWVRAHHPGPALLRRVDAGLGLTDEDFAAVAAWLSTLPPVGR